MKGVKGESSLFKPALLAGLFHTYWLQFCILIGDGNTPTPVIDPARYLHSSSEGCELELTPLKGPQ